LWRFHSFVSIRTRDDLTWLVLQMSTLIVLTPKYANRLVLKFELAVMTVMWGLNRNVRCCGLLDSTAVSAPAAKPIQAQLRVLKKDEHGLRDKLIPAAPWRVLTRLHDAGKHAVTLT
jgi:hypothetical protein